MRARAIEERLRKDILSGDFTDSAAIPSFRELAVRYHCGFATVTRAIKVLQEEGLLVTVHGKGTFVAGTSLQPKMKQANIVGVVTLAGRWTVAFENLKHEWIDKGWFLSRYDASSDMQDPEYERKFILKAQSERFSSLVMVATPNESNNAPLFKRLRHEGLKIAHLSPFQVDMSRECYFLFDHFGTGRSAVAKALESGYKHVAFIEVKKGMSPPFVSIAFTGVDSMVKELGLPRCPVISAIPWENQKAPMEEIIQIEAALIPRLLSFPKRTAFICSQFELGSAIYAVLVKAGVRVPEDYGVVALDESYLPVKPEISFFSFDYMRQVKAALEYATDGKINSAQMVQQLFPPRFNCHKTLA